MRSKDMEFTFGAIRRNTQANGLTIRCMAKVILFGLTVNNTLESSKKTNATEKANSSGKMAGSMKEAGLEANSQEQVFTRTIMERGRKAFGWMVNAKSGLTHEQSKMTGLNEY